MGSILVVELTRLGDVICMIPALGRLRRAFPEAQITCVVQEEYASLVRGLDLDLQAIGLSATQTLRGLGRGLREIRRVCADLACSMSPAKRNALLALGSGAPVKAGYLRYLNAQIQYLHESPVYVLGRNASAKASYGREHLSLRGMKVCDALGVANGQLSLMPGLRSEILTQARARIEPFLSIVRSPYIILHPFAAWVYKQWPLCNFLELAQHIIAEFNEDIVVICGEGEKMSWQDAVKGSRCTDRIHLFPAAPLLETAALMRGASAMIGNDSGPLHLAGLADVPLVGLYGPASPELTAPVGAHGEFLYRRVSCSPCAQKTCLYPDDSCMGKIAVNDVLEALRSLRGTRAPQTVSTNA